MVVSGDLKIKNLSDSEVVLAGKKCILVIIGNELKIKALSKGEIVIGKFLSARNILFHKEFIFPDLPSARFDFYIPEKNMIIEYDGQ